MIATRGMIGIFARNPNGKHLSMAFRNAIFALALTAAAIPAAVWTAPAAAQQVEGIAAVVNDQPITTVDVRDRMRLIIFSSGVQPSEDVLAQVQEQATRSLIDERLQLQTAAEFEVEVSEREVDQSLADIARRNGNTIEDIENELNQAGIGVETLRSQIRAEIAWQILVNGRYGPRIRISDDQIDTTLSRIADSASEPQFRIGEIQVNLSSSETQDDAQRRIDTIYEQLSNGAPFPQVAQQFSDAPSAASGGDAGWLTAGQLQPQVAQAVSQMQPGQISNPIRVSGGYMIAAVIDRRDGQVTEQLDLRQVTLSSSRVSETSREEMERARERLSGCSNVEDAFAGVEGANVNDLGTIGANALIAQVREAVADLEDGEATEVLDTAAGLQVFVVCGRSMAGDGVPSPEEVENDLTNQQLSLAARRWLRDIRNNATIEIR